MIMSSGEQLASDEHPLPDAQSRPLETFDDETVIAPFAAETNQLVVRGKCVTHHPKSGINPLVDAGSYLFSIIGHLKQIKSYRHLSNLHQELVSEINHFQDATKAQGYSSEHILASRYALCATL